MKPLIAFLFALALLSFVSVNNETIDGNLLDSNKLEKMILVKVNELRQSKGINVLADNPILALAAQDHANYLSETGNLSHDQKIRRKKTPMERTEYYGGNFKFVGENVAFTYLNEAVVGIKNKRNAQFLNSYEKAAQYIFDLWLYSPGHYKNMVDKDFKLSRIRFNYDSKTKRIYAVHVFAAL